jgi:recombination protein RecA
LALSGNPYKGVPYGRTISLVGDSGGGKSLLSQHILRENQKLGGISVLFDVERGIEMTQLNKIGIDTSKLVVSKAKILEDIFEKVIFFIKAIKKQSKTIPLTIVVDSISMACSRHEMEVGFDKADMGRAKIIRQGLRMINTLVADENVCFIIINHQTSNVGVMYGPAKVVTGGTAVEYVPSIVVEVCKRKTIREGDTNDGRPLGLNVDISVKKTRLYIPFVKAHVEIMFDKGFDKCSGLFDVLVQAGVVISVSSGWWAFATEPTKKMRESEMKVIIDGNPEPILKALEKRPAEVPVSEVVLETEQV